MQAGEVDTNLTEWYKPKIDKKILGNIDPKEIINFHHLDSNLKNYLCIVSSDGKFKKVLFDEDMQKSTRVFSIIKLKNSKNKKVS